MANAGHMVGAKRALKPPEVWAIRFGSIETGVPATGRFSTLRSTASAVAGYLLSAGQRAIDLPAGGSGDTAPAPCKRSTIRTYLDHQIRRLIGYDPSRKPLVMGDETRDRWRIHRGH